MRKAVLLLAIPVLAWAQSGSVYNAANEGVLSAPPLGLFPDFGWFLSTAGISPAILAPGSLAVISYAGTGVTRAATVMLRPLGSTTEIPAQVTSVDFAAIRFVVPETAPPGPVQIVYKAEGGTTNWAGAVIAPSDFALFRQYDPGPLKAQVAGPNGRLQQNGLTTPARTGDAVILWGSGLGLSKQVTVTLGGVPQKILYSGPAPSQPGIDQINFQVSPGTPNGCYVPLVVGYRGKSVTSFLSKSEGPACDHPYGLSSTDLASLDGGQTLPAAALSTTSDISIASDAHASRQETVRLSAESFNAGQIASFAAGVAPQESCALAPSSVAGAILLNPSGYISFTNATLGKGSRVFNLEPTATIPGVDSPISALAAPVLAGGPWTLSVTPSVLRGPQFQYTLTMMEPLQLTGSPLVILKRDADQTVNWRGDTYNPGAIVRLTLTWPAETGDNNISCTTAAKSGRITLPAKLLAQVPATTATLTVTVTHTNGLSAAGSPSSLVIQSGSSSDTRPVDIQ